jgi:hypothetical protein
MEIHNKKKLEIAWRTERKRMVKNWGEEKMNWRGGRGRLNANFSDGFTDSYKINYYFNIFHWWGVKNPSVNFKFRTKFFNGPPYFSQSVGNLMRSKMHLMHNPLIFAQSIRNCVGKIDNVPTTIYSSVWLSVMWWHFK